jgi:hypothetical protein
VAPSQRLHQSQVEDGWVDALGCIRSCYHCFIVFILLGHRGLQLFSLLFVPIYRTLEGCDFLPVF